MRSWVLVLTLTTAVCLTALDQIRKRMRRGTLQQQRLGKVLQQLAPLVQVAQLQAVEPAAGTGHARPGRVRVQVLARAELAHEPADGREPAPAADVPAVQLQLHEVLGVLSPGALDFHDAEAANLDLGRDVAVGRQLAQPGVRTLHVRSLVVRTDGRKRAAHFEVHRDIAVQQRRVVARQTGDAVVAAGRGEIGQRAAL